MFKMPEGRHDPICVLGSGKAQSEPTPNKSLNKGKVGQGLPPYLRGLQLESSRCVASATNPSHQHTVCCVHGVAPLYILP